MSSNSIERLVEEYLRSRVSRREFVIRSLALGMSAPAIAGLLTACGPTAAPAEPTAATPAATAMPAPTATPAAAAPRRGGQIVYGIHNELQPIDYRSPWFPEIGFSDVYEYLTAVGPDGNLVGYLADSYDVSPDGLKITYNLKKGKTFHNGDPVDAHAIKALIDWWIHPETDYNEAYYKSIDNVEAPDDSTVVLNMKSVDIMALWGTSYGFSPMVNLAVRQANPDTYGRSIAVGSGPYKFVSWEGDTAKSERFDDYSGGLPWMENKGPGYLDGLTYIWLPDQATRSINLEAGDFDIVEQPAPQDVERLRANPDIVVVERPQISVLYLGFNFKSEILQDRAIREAISRAINRTPIIDQVMFGQALPAYSPVVAHDISYWKDSETLYPYDPEKAKAILEEAGWTMGPDGVREKDGKPLELGIILLGTTEQKTTGQVIQEQLAQVGIKVNLEVLDKGTHQTRQTEGQYDMNFFRYVYDSSISVLKILYHSAWIPLPNWAYYSNPEADKWFDLYNTQMNQDEMIQSIINVQKVLLEDIVQVPIYNPTQIWAMRKWVQGWKVSDYGTYLHHHDLWVTEDSPRA